MEKKLESVESTLVSIQELINSKNQYNVPRYQRLFVWEDEQVETLLQDLFEAFSAKKDLFYLGGILIVRQKNSPNVFDLIDGQQRFTTLWLLCLELGGSLKGFTKIGNNLRLRFSIREEATKYFDDALKIERNQLIEYSNENTSLLKIDKARNKIIAFIYQFFDTVHKRNEFAEFILKAVKLIITEVPIDTDLNKLFEVTNNRGQQLLHHDILKAIILSNIENKQERIRYSKIWNACAEMDNFIEKNIQNEVGCNLSHAFNRNDESFSLNKIISVLKDKKYKISKPISLKSILEGKSAENEDAEFEENVFNEDPPSPNDDELEPVRSILSFPQLLLHTLRIYLFDKRESDINRINEKELLFTFNRYCKIKSDKDAKAFIELLWEVRVCFDLYIIKWVKIASDEESHLIKKLEKYNQYRKWTYYFRRRKPESNDGFALLQSMLYHSQQITTHYWLTPLLYKALKNRNRNYLYAYLRKLDNVLFCSGKIDTLPERTWKVIDKDLSIHDNDSNSDILDNPLGVSFPHYWFYKLEYVLWYILKDQKDDRWKGFKLTAKNSVEHISPQTPEFRQNIVSDPLLDRFGNLALVSRSINSQFSNKSYKEKRERFLASNSAKLDSLKLSMIYDNPIWNDELCHNHENEMKDLIKQYFNQN
jgi:uncharacterized protein with ParB-like and HNH nuclease domain